MRILDTTLRDGLLAKNVALTLTDKIKIATLLDQAGIEIIEIAHVHGNNIREELDVGMELTAGKACVLTDTNPANINLAIEFIRKVKGGVIHIYSMANFSNNALKTKLKAIEAAVLQAKDQVEAVQWTGFDGNRAAHDIFGKQIETAIRSGARTISIPDSMGVQNPDEFKALVKRVTDDFKSEHIDFSVHCHDDLGYALENTLAGIQSGVQQAEVTVAGIGARKGNCNLIKLVHREVKLSHYAAERLQEAESTLLAAMTDM
jgi:2-isopropylmalate synthase